MSEMPRTKALPIRLSHNQVDDAYHRVRQLMNIDVTQLTTLDKLKDTEITLKASYNTYVSLSKSLTSRYVTCGIISAVQDERIRRTSIHDDCYEYFQLINIQRQSNNFEECSNIGNLTMSSYTTTRPMNDVYVEDDVRNNNVSLSEQPKMDFTCENIDQLQISSPKARSTPVNQPTDINEFPNKHINASQRHINECTPTVVSHEEEHYAHTNKVESCPNDFAPRFNTREKYCPTTNERQFEYSFELRTNGIHLDPSQSAFVPIKHRNKPQPNYGYHRRRSPSPAIVGRIRPEVSYANTRPQTQYVHTRQPVAVQAVSTDNYFRKRELFKPTLPPFTGEPHRFHAWLNLIMNELSGIDLNPIDQIKVLMANTSGDPLKLIEGLFYAGASHPERALEKIWSSLHRQFGSDIQVSSSLLRKVKEFPAIKYMSQGKDVRELLNICELIDSYKDECNELKIFDLSSGLREIWTKLPDPIINRWRSFGNQYEKDNFGASPSLTVFIDFLEDQANEICNPNYEKSWSVEGTRPKLNLKTFQTNVEPTTEESVIPESETNYNCPLHATNSHQLAECNKFKSLPHANKRETLVEHQRCFRCVGKHMIKNCNIEIQCEKCNGNHLTLMHNDDYRLKQPAST